MNKTLNFIFYVFFTVVLLIGGVMLFRSWNDLRKMRERVAELESQVQQKHDICLELINAIYELKNNPNAIEKVAREKFKLVKENEVILTYDTKKNKKNPQRKKEE